MQYYKLQFYISAGKMKNQLKTQLQVQQLKETGDNLDQSKKLPNISFDIKNKKIYINKKKEKKKKKLPNKNLKGYE